MSQPTFDADSLSQSDQSGADIVIHVFHFEHGDRTNDCDATLVVPAHSVTPGALRPPGPYEIAALAWNFRAAVSETAPHYCCGRVVDFRRKPAAYPPPPFSDGPCAEGCEHLSDPGLEAILQAFQRVEQEMSHALDHADVPAWAQRDLGQVSLLGARAARGNLGGQH